MGLLDYYRQFEGMSVEEVNAELREEAAERKQEGDGDEHVELLQRWGAPAT